MEEIKKMIAKQEEERMEEIYRHIKNGVKISMPHTVMIEPGVEIGEGTEIEQNVILRAGTKIGKDCLIGMGTTIENSEISDGVKV